VTAHGPHTTTTTHSTTGGQGTSVTHFGPQSTTTIHPTITTTTQTPAIQTPAPAAQPSRLNPQRFRSSSIRLRRPSAQNVIPALSPSPSPQPEQAAAEDSTWQAGRRRSSSEPRPPSSALFPDDHDLRRQVTATPLQPLYEEGQRRGNADSLAPGTGPPPSRGPSTRRQAMQRQSSALNIRRGHHNNHHHQSGHTMDANVVDVLDVIGLFSSSWMHA
jgi:hypothetical protein